METCGLMVPFKVIDYTNIISGSKVVLIFQSPSKMQAKINTKFLFFVFRHFVSSHKNAYTKLYINTYSIQQKQDSSSSIQHSIHKLSTDISMCTDL